MWRRYVALFTAKNATQRGSVKREGGLVPRVPARMQLLVGEPKGVCKRPAWNRAKAATKIQLACILTAVKLNARWQLLQHKTLT